jgi:hypothetical protein
MQVRGTPLLELELPHADQALAPGALVALAQGCEVPLDRLAVRRNGQPFAGVGQRDHRGQATTAVYERCPG